MRNYIDINLNDQSIKKTDFSGEDSIRAGRYRIAKILLEEKAATVDALGPKNPLIFSAGPFGGTTWSNANRTSVGCKSPLTGGIKEANGGGTFSYGLGQLNYAGLTLHGQSDDWVIIHLKKGGEISFDDATPYLGKGNFEAAEMLHEKYGKKVSLALLGPVGEYQGLLAGVSFSDNDRRPVRIAARGGVGAVMGSKKVKAIVADLDKMPDLHDPKKTLANVKTYAKLLNDDELVQKFYRPIGTMGMADYQNRVGGLPVNNFSVGQQADTDKGEVFQMGGNFIADRNIERGGKQQHACMPGCLIQCSNVYVDADGNEIVSPVEYETLGLLGTNCGLSDPDELAAMNFIANDLGIDTIETGAMLAVLMEAGLAEFGDTDFMIRALQEIRDGTENGKIWAQGTATAGEHHGVTRIPVIKRQAISAYDPRTIEGTGVSMMTTTMGADHTVGNLPRLQTKDMSPEEIMELSLEKQIAMAANDSLGLCIFGGAVTGENLDFVVSAMNDAHGTDLKTEFYLELGAEALKMEKEFNVLAGFTAKDDDMPEFMYTEAIAPTNHVGRIRGEEVHNIFDKL